MILGTGSSKGERPFAPTDAMMNNKYAFTLIEIMVTISILSIGMAGVLRAYAVAIDMLMTVRSSIDTIYLLEEKMADMENEIIEKSGIKPGTKGGRFEGAYEGFRWDVEIEPLNLWLDLDKEELNESLNSMSLTVYNEQVKPQRRFSLFTYVENPIDENKKQQSYEDDTQKP